MQPSKISHLTDHLFYRIADVDTTLQLVALLRLDYLIARSVREDEQQLLYKVRLSNTILNTSPISDYFQLFVERSIPPRLWNMLRDRTEVSLYGGIQILLPNLPENIRKV